MHIMQLVSGTEAMNGAMIHTVQLCRRLVERGHRVTLVSRPDSGVLEAVDGLDLEIVESPQHRIPADQLRRVAAIVRQRGVEVMHAHMSRAQFFAVLLKQMTGIPCVATAHCQKFKPHRMWNDFVIANSDANRRTQIWKNLVRPGRIETVYCPVDLEGHRRLAAAERIEVRASLAAADDAPLIGLVGNVYARKGHDVLIRALPAVLAQHPAARVAFVGNEFGREADQFKQLAQELNVAGAIHWAGFRNDIPRVMAALDLCVAPSRGEPFGLTPVEALAVGTPVVASRVGGLPETVVHGETGLLVPPGKPQPLAKAIGRLLSDRELYQRCSTQGQQAMRERYDPERLWNRIETILHAAGSRKRVPAAADLSNPKPARRPRGFPAVCESPTQYCR